MVCGLFAIPADIAIALSMVKRARELWVGIPGLMLWQWSEVQRLIRRHTIQRSLAGQGCHGRPDGRVADDECRIGKWVRHHLLSRPGR
jgi:hypothetical protein